MPLPTRETLNTIKNTTLSLPAVVPVALGLGVYALEVVPAFVGFMATDAGLSALRAAMRMLNTESSLSVSLFIKFPTELTLLVVGAALCVIGALVDVFLALPLYFLGQGLLNLGEAMCQTETLVSACQSIEKAAPTFGGEARLFSKVTDFFKPKVGDGTPPDAADFVRQDAVGSAHSSSTTHTSSHVPTPHDAEPPANGRGPSSHT